MDRYELLMTTRVDIGHGRMSVLIELIDGWAGHVARLWEEGHQDESLGAWGVHDFVAALFLRSRVARGLLQANLSPPGVLRVADELFREFTEPDELGALARIVPGLDFDGWWWSRVPRLGPIAAVLRSEIPRPDR